MRFAFVDVSTPFQPKSETYLLNCRYVAPAPMGNTVLHANVLSDIQVVQGLLYNGMSLVTFMSLASMEDRRIGDTATMLHPRVRARAHVSARDACYEPPRLASE